jgi:hypothetical protein
VTLIPSQPAEIPSNLHITPVGRNLGDGPSPWQRSVIKRLAIDDHLSKIARDARIIRAARKPFGEINPLR